MLYSICGSVAKIIFCNGTGKTVDDAMTAIERDNNTLKGVLPKTYAREGLDKQRLGELIDLVDTIGPKFGDSTKPNSKWWNHTSSRLVIINWRFVCQ